MAGAIIMEKVVQPKLAQHESSILDLVFVMDCTSSMALYIASATDNIRSIVEEIVVSEKSDIRLALVEYRDHPPQDNTFVTRVHDFTAKVSEMKGWLGQCQAFGGGDTAEAVADGLHAVLKLSWRAQSTKICILIADAPPHGLDPILDGFSNGCPCGLDPVQIVREMVEKYITLYSVGVEPPITRYRDFFMSLAYTTGGQYVPMVNAKLLAKVIIGGVREEISLDRLMQVAEEDINREMQQAEAEGVDEKEKVKRINNIFSTKNLFSTQMTNTFGTPSVTAKGFSSTCHTMAEMQSAFVAAPQPASSLFTTTSTGPFSPLFGTPLRPAFAPITSIYGSGATSTAAPSASFTFGAPLRTVPTATSIPFAFSAPSTTGSGTISFGFGTPLRPAFAPITSIYGSSATSTAAPSAPFTFGAPLRTVPTATSIPFAFSAPSTTGPGTASFGFGVPSTTAPFSFATLTDSFSTDEATLATKTVTDINYDVTENAVVNEDQAERIFQKWQHRKK